VGLLKGVILWWVLCARGWVSSAPGSRSIFCTPAHLRRTCARESQCVALVCKGSPDPGAPLKPRPSKPFWCMRKLMTATQRVRRIRRQMDQA